MTTLACTVSQKSLTKNFIIQSTERKKTEQILGRISRRRLVCNPTIQQHVIINLYTKYDSCSLLQGCGEIFDEKVLRYYGRTDGTTDGMTDKWKPVYPPLFPSGGIKMFKMAFLLLCQIILKSMHKCWSSGSDKSRQMHAYTHIYQTKLVTAMSHFNSTKVARKRMFQEISTSVKRYKRLSHETLVNYT